jgi:hypothetical protein
MIAWLKRLFHRKRKPIVGLKPISHGEWLMTLEWGSPEYEAVMRNARNMMRLTAIIHMRFPSRMKTFIGRIMRLTYHILRSRLDNDQYAFGCSDP